MIPKVSVVIPVYNVFSYLNRTITSVISQKLEPLEIILVDDGSTDGCYELVENWKEKDPRIIAVHQSNGGVISARNTGLSRSTGEYVFFLDGDDYLLPHCLEVLYNQARSANADWVVSDFIVEYSDGRTLNKLFPDFGKVDAYGFLDYAYRNSDFYYTGRLIKASFIKSIDLSVPYDITFGEDNICVTQLGSQISIAIKVNSPSLVYVQRDDSVTNKIQLNDLIQRARACKLCNDYLKEKGFDHIIKQSMDSYFIKEYCAFISRGILPESLSFVHKECKLKNANISFRERFFYILSLISNNASLKLYRLLKAVL